MKPSFKLNKPESGSVAIVTGAGSGIGRCFAQRLAKMGYDIVLVGLDMEGLEQTKGLIGEASRCWCVECDLARTDSAEELYAWCAERDIEPGVVVNNAGVFAFCDVAKLSLESIERLLLLHCMTLTKICRLFAPRMEACGGGYILNISSFSQWMPFPGLSLYAASKAYVRSFSVSFSKEVEQSGVVVTSVAPAGVATPLYGLPEGLQRLGVRVGALITADSCARRSLRALSWRRRSVVPDWWNVMFIPICRHLPSFVERWLRRKTMKLQKEI